ncbi:hypothetical protein FRC02_010594 [Tulasnella sp. 418]|nr:hypothetical protein FRC02_010594 [Tulasnella sp. 418]
MISPHQPNEMSTSQMGSMILPFDPLNTVLINSETESDLVDMDGSASIVITVEMLIVLPPSI